MIIRLLAALLVMFAFVFSTPVMASGKLTLQNNFQNNGKEYRPMVGLGIYEKVAGSALNLWTGYGKQWVAGERDDVDWYVAKGQVDIPVLNRLTVAPGIQYRKAMSEHSISKQDTTLFVRLDYQLW
jgi:hypothetical protein